MKEIFEEYIIARFERGSESVRSFQMEEGASLLSLPLFTSTVVKRDKLLLPLERRPLSFLQALGDPVTGVGISQLFIEYVLLQVQSTGAWLSHDLFRSTSE